jgi:hypothetical protein
MVQINQWGWNTQVHGSNARNLSVRLSLSQTSKNAMSFLFSLMFPLQQNWRTREQNRFFPEWGCGRRKEVAQTMYTHVGKCKNERDPRWQLGHRHRLHELHE